MIIRTDLDKSEVINRIRDSVYTTDEYVVHLSWSDHHFDGCPRYKLLKQNELMDYMEWYHNNIYRNYLHEDITQKSL